MGSREAHQTAIRWGAVNVLPALFDLLGENFLLSQRPFGDDQTLPRQHHPRSRSSNPLVERTGN